MKFVGFETLVKWIRSKNFASPFDFFLNHPRELLEVSVKSWLGLNTKHYLVPNNRLIGRVRPALCSRQALATRRSSFLADLPDK